MLLLNYMDLEPTLHDVVHNHNVTHIIALVQAGTAGFFSRLRSTLPELRTVVALGSFENAGSVPPSVNIGGAVHFAAWLKKQPESPRRESAFEYTGPGYQLIARTNSFGCTELVVYNFRSVVQWYLRRRSAHPTANMTAVPTAPAPSTGISADTYTDPFTQLQPALFGAG